MNKVKHNTLSIIRCIRSALTGIALWLLTAAVLSWFVLSGKLNESVISILAPLAQGVIAYIVATMTFLGRAEERAIDSLIAPFAFIVSQVAITLLLWGIDFYGLIKNLIAVFVGSALSFLTYKFKLRTGKSRKFHKFPR